ncbi:hypothetical protein AGLY_006911 [Aphis glycines]|uniref:Uncharacterized protein n=1 Tax=Aphis glycines TaxID=307491 RepID=A0A6G0TSB3_APHGL|nr:hypothetical protein AGLY_006911 [Aphis glycines]
MAVFAQSTRNVHKELKETICIVMTQLTKIRNAGPDNRTKNTSTQKPSKILSKTKADSAQPPDHARAEFSGALMKAKDILKKQSEAINKLTTQTEVLQQQQQQQQQRQQQQQHQQGYSRGNEDGGTWTDIVRRKPSKSEHRTEQRIAEKRDTVKVRWSRTKTRPTAILVDIDG